MRASHPGTDIFSPPTTTLLEQARVSPAHSEWAQSGDDGESRMNSLLRNIFERDSNQILEEDGVEEKPAPLRIRKRDHENWLPASLASQASSDFERNDMTFPTASSSRYLPLSHPRPDAQFLQGTYTKKVEHLEEGAERRSMTSSLEDEIYKMKLEQRLSQSQLSASTRDNQPIKPSPQLSSFSYSNSIGNGIAPVGPTAYSPYGYIPCSRDMTPSRSWSQASYQNPRLPTDAQAERALSPDSPIPPPPPPHATLPSNSFDVHTDGLFKRTGCNPLYHRPYTSADGDNSLQALTSFQDFDGVHCSTSSLLSTSKHPSLASHKCPDTLPAAVAVAQSSESKPQVDKDTIFYPAPVPAMLNLPPKLSTVSAVERERRRAQMVGGLPLNVQKMAPRLEADANKVLRARRNLAGLPPQLRAAAYFEHLSVPQEFKLVGDSATATLESLLDAAAIAPMGAFTDQSILSPVKTEIDGKNHGERQLILQDLRKEQDQQRVSSLSNMIDIGHRTTKTASVTNYEELSSQESRSIDLRSYQEVQGEYGCTRPCSADLERVSEPSIHVDIAGIYDENNTKKFEFQDVEAGIHASGINFQGLSAAPTTLLAELQIRKAQQNDRNRTAGFLLPGEVHSTLLSRDAVTQIQQKSRKQKHITLAWEDQTAAEEQNFADEDIPLGVLFPAKEQEEDDKRLTGLLQKCEVEQNEPLSHRRARLKSRADAAPQSSTYPDQDSGFGCYKVGREELLDANLDERDEETLAQRLQRIKGKKKFQNGENSTTDTSRPLCSEVENIPFCPDTLDAAETLAQRRRRLMQETANRSIKSIGGTHPRGARNSASRPNANDFLSAQSILGAPISPPQNFVLHHPAGFEGPSSILPNHRPLMPLTNTPYVLTAPRIHYPNFPPGLPFMNSGFMNVQPAVYSPSVALHLPRDDPVYGDEPEGPSMGPLLDEKQRESIDRWRQSVV